MAKKSRKLKLGQLSEGSVELDPDELSEENTKIRITMFLDSSTLKRFKQFAQLTNGKYQSLLNECLDSYGEEFLEQKLQEIKKSILNFERKKA